MSAIFYILDEGILFIMLATALLPLGSLSAGGFVTVKVYVVLSSPSCVPDWTGKASFRLGFFTLPDHLKSSLHRYHGPVEELLLSSRALSLPHMFPRGNRREALTNPSILFPSLTRPF